MPIAVASVCRHFRTQRTHRPVYDLADLYRRSCHHLNQEISFRFHSRRNHSSNFFFFCLPKYFSHFLCSLVVFRIAITIAVVSSILFGALSHVEETRKILEPIWSLSLSAELIINCIETLRWRFRFSRSPETSSRAAIDRCSQSNFIHFAPSIDSSLSINKALTPIAGHILFLFFFVSRFNCFIYFIAFAWLYSHRTDLRSNYK